MNRKLISAVSFIIFSLCAIGIVVLALWPSRASWLFGAKEPQERHRTRIIVPSVSDGSNPNALLAERLIFEERANIKSPLNEGEIPISVLNFDFDNNAIEEQVIAYRNLLDAGSPVSIAFFSYDELSGTYRRQWNAATAATIPGTVSLYTQDLLGDRSVCIIVTGMNTQGEHTMTVFRENSDDKNRPFNTIAKIQMDGSIIIQESDHSRAYQQGIARRQPFTITAGGRDSESDNMLDRIEITYTFNPSNGIYEQNRINRVPGSQVEQRRVREILSGNPKIFENFINDLWYHVSPQGTIDRSQYLYFDPEKREIIFFGDDSQQVFIWHNSTSTRYGLYISSQNISVSTMRRFLDIEMTSLDSIRIRVFDDVRMKITLSASWDGSYRRAGNIAGSAEEKNTINPYTDAVYDSSMGRLSLFTNGEYTLSSSGVLTKGVYAFFQISGQELLELRPERNGVHGSAHGGTHGERFIYAITGAATIHTSENISLSRVRLGSSGIQELHEGHIVLTRVGNMGSRE
ncbi:MAG: pallilysin-related adhesin [Treponema sp.]|nr:pallilysin-related adhesin [Treponema sp.]